MADDPGAGQGPLPAAHRRDASRATRSGRERHWQTIAARLRAGAVLRRLRDRLEALYRDVADEPSLSAVNHALPRRRSARCSASTPPLTLVDRLRARGRQPERLVSLCLAGGRNAYLSGPAARAYLDEDAVRAPPASRSRDGLRRLPGVRAAPPAVRARTSASSTCWSTPAPTAPRYLRASAGARGA